VILKCFLICLAAVVMGGCSKETTQTPPLFRDAAAETGLNFRHFTGATGQYYLPEIMGPGVALLDYDNDGDLDVYLIQSSSFSGNERNTGNRLFRNELKETGNLKFTDVTEKAGVGFIGYGMGVAVGDYDNDGHPDIYVTNFGANFLYNNGNRSFTDVTTIAGVNDPRWSTSASFLDYDRDGNLDLFVLNYVDFTVEGNKACFASTGERDYCTPKAYHPVSARLFHNLGNGKFTDVTEKSGVGAAYGPGLGIATGDFNGDGWPDIYVANDTAANLLWLNQKNGTFREAALESGAAYASDGVARAGMGVTAGDFDCDGHDDILVTNLTREGATLFRGNGKGEFEDITLKSGLAQATAGSTGFGTKWFDYDNDGPLDLFIANGAVTLIESQRGKPRPFEQPNLLFHNEAGKFRHVSGVAGSIFGIAAVARGAAFGDIDNDGDIDIVVANNDGPVRLLLNETGSKKHWLEVRLDGGASNRFGIGSRVGLMRRGQPTIWRNANTDSGYLSAHDPRVHFGLGGRPEVDALTVRWADGSKESWTGMSPDKITTLRKGTGKP
jgi:hypothetical protein